MIAIIGGVTTMENYTSVNDYIIPISYRNFWFCDRSESERKLVSQWSVPGEKRNVYMHSTFRKKKEGFCPLSHQENFHYGKKQKSKIQVYQKESQMFYVQFQWSKVGVLKSHWKVPDFLFQGRTWYSEPDRWQTRVETWREVHKTRGQKTTTK